jgi:chromosome partitioning protein
VTKEENMSKVIAVANQKGGVGKSTSVANLGIGLSNLGYKVLAIDLDSQGSLTASLGFTHPDKLDTSIANMMTGIINEEPLDIHEGIIHHEEGIDLMPSNIELSGLEVSLVNVMGREMVLKEYVDRIRDDYDYILIDCMPSLGMLTINALACADSVLIPVQAAYLPVKGLEQLLMTINKVRRQINPSLQIEGILITMVDSRTGYARDICELIKDSYKNAIRVFDKTIPMSVRAAETSAEGISIFKHDPKGKVAEAYKELAREVADNGK